ncbi:uncharacterized protein GIQ15_03472 [Arthroderma uncinatum]|uniref:uncharacterized protein n=1 Tax=Arthroderma uncinatum TaxID=74035 RepID=UPI00144A7715|nr:uncharacterized protein GIQ15_03472 [Arthroderma uncinatum]KAF3484148.1 hypothetical protein GIQ15_03472 [Arthroderma uncinatum]
MRLSVFSSKARFTLAPWTLMLLLLSAICSVSAHSIRFPLDSSIAIDGFLPDHQFGSGPTVELRTIDADPRHPADLQRRAESDSSLHPSPTSKKQPKPTSGSGSTTLPPILSTPTGTVGTSIVVATPTASAGPLPTAFDTSRSDNTTVKCSAFFDTFLSNSTFNDCVPISLLLKTSSSFFANTKSFALLTRTLDAACSAPADKCTTLLSHYADMIGQDDKLLPTRKC